MALKKETLIFVNRRVLHTGEGLIYLRRFLKSDDIPTNTVVRGYEDNGIVATFPSYTQRELTVYDESFQKYFEQKLKGGYLYVSVKNLRSIVDSLLADFCDLDEGEDLDDYID